MKRVFLSFLVLIVFAGLGSLLAEKKGKAMKLKGESEKGASADFETGKRIAILIGVNRYTNGGLANLNFAADDAEKMSVVLKDIGKYDKVILLNDNARDENLKPTRDNIQKQFDAALKEKPYLLIFYFSGHGFMDKEGRNVIAPADIITERAEKKVISVQNALVLWDLEKKAKDHATQSLFLIDACREEATIGIKGGGEAAAFSDKILPDDVKDGKGVAVLIGTAPGKYSYEISDKNTYQGGRFTHYITKALSGELQKKGASYVTLKGLQEYVITNVKEESKGKQVPYALGDFSAGRDILLGTELPSSLPKEVIVQYFDKNKNKIEASIFYDTKGRPINQKFFKYDRDNKYQKAELDGVARMSFEYGDDDKSYIAKQFDLADNLIFVYGVKYDREEKTWEIKHSFVPDKDRKNTKDLRYVRSVFDQNGNLVLKEFKKDDKPDGELLEDEEGYARYRFAFDNRGNEILREYYGYSDDVGRRGSDEEGRKRGNASSPSQDTKKQLKLKADKFGIARYVRSFDANGNILSEEFKGEDARLKNNPEGAAQVLYNYDSNENLISTEYFDLESKPANNQFGVAKFTYEYDSEDRLIRQKFFDEEGKPTGIWFEYGKIVRLDTPSGHRVDAKASVRDAGRHSATESTILDTIRKTEIPNEKGWVNGAHEIHYEYYEGTEFATLVEFKDAKSRLKNNEFGIAKIVRKIEKKETEAGMPVYAFTEEYYDENGEKSTDRNRVFRYVYTFKDFSCFDHAGWDVNRIKSEDSYWDKDCKVSEEYYGTDEKLTAKDGRAAMYTYQYSKSGKLINKTAWDELRLIIKDLRRSTRTVYAYDNSGKPFVVIGYDEKDRITSKRFLQNLNDYAVEYDENDRDVRGSFFNKEGDLAVNRHGDAGYKLKYNEKGYTVLFEYFGTNEKPKERYGFARIVNAYDDNCIRLGKEDSECETLHETYGADGKLKEDKDGIARKVIAYDENCIKLGKKDSECKVLSETYGADGKLKEDKDGIARYLYKYNDKGYRILGEYFGTDGKLKESKDSGIARIVIAYDENCIKLGKKDSECRILLEVYGTDGKLKEIKDSGIARIVIAYDENCIKLGKKDTECETLIETYGADGKLKEHKDNGIARSVYKYNDNGNRIIKEFYGSDGKLKEIKDSGIARIVIAYDGNCIKLGKKDTECQALYETYGSDGKLKEHKDNGIARSVYKYNDNGNRIIKEFYGSDGKLKEIKDSGIARIVIAYDENCIRLGKKDSECETLIETYGADGKLKEHIDSGIARTVIAYDENCIKLGEKDTKCNKLYEAYGADGKLKEHKDSGIARYIYKYSDKGNEIVREFYGTDGKLKEHKDSGIAKTVTAYDENCIRLGKKDSKCETLIERYGADGKLKEDIDGIARYIYKYNDKGNEIVREFYGTDGKLKEIKDSGIAKTVTAYDENCIRLGKKDSECETLIETYGADGKFKGNSSGIARYVSAYNETGEKIVELQVKSDSNFIYTSLTRDTIIPIHDAKGRLWQTHFFGLDENGKPAYKHDENGVHKYIYEYVEGKKIIRGYDQYEREAYYAEYRINSKDMPWHASTDRASTDKDSTDKNQLKEDLVIEEARQLEPYIAQSVETIPESSLTQKTDPVANSAGAPPSPIGASGRTSPQEKKITQQREPSILFKHDYQMFFPNNSAMEGKRELKVRLDRFFRPIGVKFE